MFEAFFFGENTLFGCYHPPSDAASRRLLVICPPFFDEYRRCYRSLAELANACAEEGLHVIRFDYYGTGESFGQLAEVTDLRWIDDIKAAIDEGIALSGADQVILAGVRFGATLASACQHPAIKRLVLWDPQNSGEDLVKTVTEVRIENEKNHKQLARKAAVKTDIIDYSQFTISPDLKSALPSIKLADEFGRSCVPWQVITTSSSANLPIQAQADRLEIAYTGTDYDWPIYHKGELVSKPILETLARHILKP